MVLKRSKLQREDIPLPSFRREAKSSLPADFQQQFDDNLSSESRHRKNLFIQVARWMNANENAIDDGLWIHRYTKCYSRKAISPLPLSSPFSSIQRIESSTWKRMDRVQGGQLRRAIQAWSGIIVVALEPIAVVYISYQKQRIFLRGVSSASRLIVASTSYRSREIDVDVLNDSLEKEREREEKGRGRREIDWKLCEECIFLLIF